MNPGYLEIVNHGLPLLKLVLILSVATNNPLNIFDTSPAESTIFYKVGILQITQDDSLHQRKLNILHLEEKICRYTFHQELLQNYKMVKHIKRKCKTCLGQHFEHIIYIHICDP